MILLVVGLSFCVFLASGCAPFTAVNNGEFGVSDAGNTASSCMCAQSSACRVVQSFSVGEFVVRSDNQGKRCGATQNFNAQNCVNGGGVPCQGPVSTCVAKTCSLPTVYNGAGTCVCPSGETDENNDETSCAPIDLDQCAVPVSGCDDGQLKADNLCLDVEGEGPTAMVTLDGQPCDIVNGIFFSEGDFVTAASLNCGNGRFVSWFSVGVDCQASFLDTGSSDRKRQSPPLPAFVALASSALGDPHLSGAHGEKFDFFGVDGGIYNLFSTKQFVINVLLGKEAKNHFIKHVGVCFRGKCEQFGLARQRVPEHFISTLNKQLSKVGGSARFPQKTQMIIELELCQGHRIVLVKKMTARGKQIAYFDVEVEVPGCHDDFDGALGQTYKCKYAGEHKEKFVFQKSMEEHFRVKSLTSQFGLYNSTMVAPCQSVESFNTQGKSVSGKAHH